MVRRVLATRVPPKAPRFLWPCLLRPLFGKSLMCKLLKIKWSGRVDSNHRPPGPEPWEGPFCTPLHVFANYPYRAVLFIFSMASRVCALHWLAAVCRLSLHEKGKKRASLGKPRGLFASSFDRDVDRVCRASIDAENQRIPVRRGQTFGQAQVHLIHPDETRRGPGVFDRDAHTADSARDIR